jgi:flagellar secretion chaperone FliS
MPYNAATAYQNNKISTASPGKLTLMLYEGAIKFCNIAIIGIEESNISRAHNNILKVEKIIDYLRSTLDYKYPVAQDFENIYKYLNDRLIEANIYKSKETLEIVLGHLRDLRDNWTEIMKNA